MKIRLVLYVCIAIFAGASTATANDDFWNNFAGGIWGTGTNWIDGSTPGANDTATLNALGSIYTINFNAAPAAIRALTLNAFAANEVTLASSGGPFTLNVNSASGTQDVLVPSGTLTLGTATHPLHLTVGDDTTVGGTLNVLNGSQVTTNDLIVDGNGNTVVSGAGSFLNTSTVSLGTTGATSRLTYSAGSTGALGSANIGVASSAAAAGVLRVDSGTTIGAGNINVGTGTAGSGTIEIQGAGSKLQQAGAFGVVVGSASGSIGRMNVGTTASGAILDTGSNGLTVNPTGIVNIGSTTSTGQALIFGPVNVVGGQWNVRTGSNFSILGGETINVSNGGSVLLEGGIQTSSTTNVTMGGDFTIGTRLRLNAGGVFIVDGAGSTLVTNTIASTANEINGTLTLRNGSGATFGGEIVFSAGTIQVESGAQLIAGQISGGGTLRIQSGASASTGNLEVSVVEVTGVGSTLSLNPGANLVAGIASFGGTKILDGASLSVSASGTTTLGTSSMLTIDGGSAALNNIVFDGGTLDFVKGSLSFAGNFIVGSGGLLGSDVTLINRHVTNSGSTIIDAGHALILDGGTLNTGNLIVNGSFVFNSGTLGLSLAGTNLNMPVVTGSPLSAINILANNISLGSTSSFNGFHHLGTLQVGGNTVTLNSAGYARLGVLTSLAGGTINAANGVVFASGSNLSGSGIVNARITGESGSVIEASGTLNLGDTASLAGFNFQGELRVRQHMVTLRSSGQATLGNLTVLGNGSNAGTINATNGLIVDFGNAITGFGTVSSTNTLAKRTIINGTAQGTSAALPLTFTGYVKGTGTFNNVNFSGTFSPGLSPSVLTVGNLAFASTNTLIMELGGLSAGNQYDQILSNGTLAVGGILQVALIDGFTPAAGNTFNLFDFASLAGTFSSLSLPTLAGLSWDTSQLYSNGIISVTTATSLPGDFNNDGRVDSRDYVVWRKFNNTSQVLPNDPNPLPIDIDQYATWRQNYGRSIGGSGGESPDSQGANVPEPPNATLWSWFLVAALVQCFNRSR